MKNILLFLVAIIIMSIILSPALLGQGENALNFQNLNYMTHGDFVYCGSPDYGFTNKITVAAWVKWTTNPQSFAVTPVSHEREGQYSTYIAYASHNSNNNGQFWLRDSKSSSNYEFSIQNTSGTIITASSGSSPALSTWVFLAGVYDGSNVQIYVNGILEKSENLTGNIKTNVDGTHRLNMGRLPWGYGFFVGYLDEVRIWKAALTMTQINQQMASKATIDGANLVSYWNFDAGSGTNIDDSGVQNADGVFYTCLDDVHSITISPYTLSDNDKTWGVNAWQNCTFKTVSGAGVDETNTVSSNTAVVCTLLTAWTTTPIIDGTANMSWFGVEKTGETSQWVVSDAPMPVELTSFTAQAIGNTITLYWCTATEVNNYGFEIDRRAVNREQQTVNSWQKIGFVRGAGTCNAPKEYSYMDATCVAGSYLYRLKQIDQDGSYKYSAAVEVSFMKPAESVLSQNYPNPFNPSTVISYQIPPSPFSEKGERGGFVTLNVYDMLGREIAVLVHEQKEPGNYTAEFNGAKYSSGIYFFKLTTNQFASVRKMTLLK